MNVDKLKALNARLTALLADPEPGLVTWTSAVAVVCEELATAIGGTAPRTMADAQRICGVVVGTYDQDLVYCTFSFGHDGPHMGIVPYAAESVTNR